MSADDFQTKYSCVMEGMLKSAVAETTKLFETMVDELKAEISKIKKENEDLKRKCSQFEKATRQTTNDGHGSDSGLRKSDSSEKRDTAVQCDLVPFRAMLVEQCEPLHSSPWLNQKQPCGNDTMEYVWQEHNYENREGRNSQRAFIQPLKDSPQHTVVKQEEVDPPLSCGHVKGAEVVNSACENENQVRSSNQECSTAEILLPQRNENTQVGLELPQLKKASSSGGVHNQPSGLVRSSPAVEGNMEKEPEVGPQISEIRTQGKLITAKRHLVAVAQSQSKAELKENEQSSDSKISVNEQMDAECSSQLADKPSQPDQSKANDELTNGKLPETEPDQPVKRKRGRPPKKTKQQPVKQILPPKCTPENKAPESQQLSVGIKSGASQKPSLRVSSTAAKPDTPTTESLQEASPRCRERLTSATLQDAMLLVEAMNQSTDKSEPSSPQRKAATTPTLKTLHEVPVVPEKTPISFRTEAAASNTALQATTAPEALAQKKTDAPKQQPAVTLSCTDTTSAATLTAATQTSVSSVEQHPPQIKSVAQSKQCAAVTQRIIVMSRSSASLMPCKFARKSATQQPPVVSSVLTAENNSEVTKLTSTGISPVKVSPCSAPQKNIFVTPDKSLPAPPTDLRSGSLSKPRVTILVPRQLSAVALRKQLQAIDLSTKQESAKSSNPDVVPSQLIPSSQEVGVSVDAPITHHNVTMVLTAEQTNTFDNLESPKQTMKEPTDTARQMSPAVVRLTRLPLSMSTQEAVSLKSLHPSLTSKMQSPLKKSTTKEEPPSVVVSTQPPETRLSSDVCMNTKDDCVVVFEASVLDGSANSGDVAAELSTSKLEMDIAAWDSTSPSDPSMEQQPPAVIHLTSIKSKDTADPHSQMTKTQFLAQLAVSPILQDQVEPPTGDPVAADASCPMTSTSKETSQEENTFVTKLRRHLKTHLQARHPKTNQELCIETEILTSNSKNHGNKTESQDDSSQTVESIPLDPKKQLTVVKTTSPVETSNTNTSPVITRRSRICKDDLKSKRPADELAPVSPQRLKATGESTPVNPRSCSGRDCISSKNKKPTLVISRKPNSVQEGTVSVRRRIVSLSPRDSSSTKESASLKKTKTTTVQSRRTNSSRDNSNSKSDSAASHPTNSETPKTTNCTGLFPKTTSNESTSFVRRKCTLSQVGAINKVSKSKSDVLNPRSCDISADDTPTKGIKSGTNLHSARRLELPEDVRSSKTRESTPAQKRKFIPESSSQCENLESASCKRLAKAATAKTPNKSPPGPEGLRKLTAKGVWTPPILTVWETPLAGEKKSPNSTPIKTETKTPSPTLVYPPSVSLHPIPVRAPPVVSPLQPLSVIGWRLLKNQCGECGRVLSSSAALESHVSLHTGHRPFSCKLCGKRFPDSKGLKRHGRVHRNGRIHICKQCGKGFVYSFGLTKHLQMVHSRIKPFVCQVCNKGFFSKRDVEAHIRIHTGEKPFHCNLCEKKFARRTELNVHLRWHNGEKRHWCPFCGKGFLDINNLKRHKYTHTGEKPHSCPHCPKNFKQSGHLKKHVRNVHKMQC